MQTYIKTYGCTLNNADSDIMRAVLLKDNIGIASSADAADVIVLNTCTVKRPTEQRILYEIDSLRAKGRRVVVAGCMAGANLDSIEKHMPEASIVSTGNLHRIGDAVAAAGNGRKVVFRDAGSEDKLLLFAPAGGVIARVPISEGCLSSCTFCETKFAREKMKSFSEELIIRAIRESVRNGAVEVQLTAQDVGAYGADNGTNIAKLMERVCKIDGDFKVRIGMLNPDHLGAYIDEVISSMQDGKFYRFLHLPVQSGSDRVIRDMGRRCTTDEFSAMVKELRSKVDGISIETDLIVGYPSETEEDSDETLAFVKRVKPDMINVSKFGPRPHTRAARMTQLDNETVKRRSVELSRVAREVQNSANAEFLGRTVRACITEVNDNSSNGKTDSYRQVVVKRSDSKGLELGGTADLRVYASSAYALYCRA